jgi:hypothetical protein
LTAGKIRKIRNVKKITAIRVTMPQRTRRMMKVAK